MPEPVTLHLRALTTRLVHFISSRRFMTKFLICIWAVFLILVALGIHGSSTGITAEWWAPEKPYTGYLFNAPTRSREKPTRPDPASAQSILMNNARAIRWDELAIFTPFALSQLAQQPRFPVINTSIGNGQNMLVVPHAPVWHITTLARPATWGYFILGAQRGIAWFWWFQIFACFTVLFLLFEIILQGNRGLAAFGAFWFCASAYIVCWSQWSAHVTFFAALGCLAAYRLFSSEKIRAQLTSAILLGLSFPGFVMIMYPPWQVAAAYFFILIFIVLFIRDKLYLSFKTEIGYRISFLALAILVAAGLTLSWLAACLPDLRVMASTVYPGRRVSLGGDYSFGMVFKGLYNLWTIYNEQPALRNQSEAASFYYLFPAVFVALPLSRRLTRKFGVIGWSLAAYVICMLLFLFVGLPAALAKLTLLSYVPTYRADLTLGLASILLCVYVLTILKRADQPATTRREIFMPWIASSAVVLLFILHSVFLLRMTGGFPAPQLAWGISLVMGVAAYFLLSGKRRAFCALIGALVIATTALFNPLATNLDHLYDSELARVINQINSQSTERPFWLCYGGVHPGQLLAILGSKSLSGVQWPPQLSIWRALDPARTYEEIYNQYAEVSLRYSHDNNLVTFTSRNEGELSVSLCPTNPVLKSLGARYVLLMADAQPLVNTNNLRLLYRSTFDNFSVFEIP